MAHLPVRPLDPESREDRQAEMPAIGYEYHGFTEIITITDMFHASGGLIEVNHI